MRLHLVVEGQTEETFVRNLLAPELGAKGIFCDAHSVTTGRRGGKAIGEDWLPLHICEETLNVG